MSDIPDDRAELVFSSLAETNEAITHEIAADEEANDALVSRIAARKFQDVNPIEAAASEAILTLAE